MATNEALPYTVLSQRSLPLKPSPIILVGTYIKLTPFDPERDASILYSISNGNPYQIGDKSIEKYDCNSVIWKNLMSGPYFSEEEFYAYYKERGDTPNNLLLTVFDISTNQQIGMSGCIENDPMNLSIEIGNVWLCNAFHHTNAATEMTYLLLNHCFGLGYRRINWKINANNSRSANFAKKIGFLEDLYLKSYGIVKDVIVDAINFRILDCEWDEIKIRLEQRLYNS